MRAGREEQARLSAHAAREQRLDAGPEKELDARALLFAQALLGELRASDDAPQQALAADGRLARRVYSHDRRWIGGFLALAGCVRARHFRAVCHPRRCSERKARGG